MRLHLVPRWKGCWKVIFVFRERFFEVGDPELEFTRQSLRPGGVFVDAGAYHGWYTLVASKVVGEGGRVVAFEPNPDTFSILTRNIALNDCQNVQAFNVALSNADGRVWIYKSSGDGIASSLGKFRETEGREYVATRRLDDILEELKIRRVDFMKIDVEGSEANLLQGAIRTLNASRPTVVFEINPAVARNVGVPERGAWDILAGQGYSFFRLSATELVPLTEYPAALEKIFLNVVALHESALASGWGGVPLFRPSPGPQVV